MAQIIAFLIFVFLARKLYKYVQNLPDTPIDEDEDSEEWNEDDYIFYGGGSL